MSELPPKLEALIEASFRFAEGKSLSNAQVVLIAENQLTGLLLSQNKNAKQLAADPHYVMGVLTGLILLLGDDEKERKDAIHNALAKGGRCLAETELYKSFSAQLEKDLADTPPTSH